LIFFSGPFGGPPLWRATLHARTPGQRIALAAGPEGRQEGLHRSFVDWLR
jgi:hypothetical protein